MVEGSNQGSLVVDDLLVVGYVVGECSFDKMLDQNRSMLLINRSQDEADQSEIWRFVEGIVDMEYFGILSRKDKVLTCHLFYEGTIWLAETAGQNMLAAEALFSIVAQVQ